MREARCWRRNLAHSRLIGFCAEAAQTVDTRSVPLTVIGMPLEHPEARVRHAISVVNPVCQELLQVRASTTSTMRPAPPRLEDAR
jgi:hypothetical protein